MWGEIKQKILEMERECPGLSNVAIAECIGASRERVRQVLGRRPNAKARHPRYCSTCGVRLLLKRPFKLANCTDLSYELRLCRVHWYAQKEEERAKHYVSYRCETCNREFTRYACRYRMKKGLRTRWCSHKCQAVHMRQFVHADTR